MENSQQKYGEDDLTADQRVRVAEFVAAVQRLWSGAEIVGVRRGNIEVADPYDSEEAIQ